MMTLDTTTLGQRIGHRFKYETPWTFSTSSGWSGSYSFAGVGGGSLYMVNSSSREKGTLRCVNGGLSLGLNPSASSQYSTADMWSKGLLMSAKSSLTFDDLTGPMCVLSGAVGLPYGMPGASISYVFLGFPVGLALLGGAIEIILSGLLTARAFGVLAGRFQMGDPGQISQDASISLMAGYATSIALLDRIFG